MHITKYYEYNLTNNALYKTSYKSKVVLTF